MQNNRKDGREDSLNHIEWRSFNVVSTSSWSICVFSRSPNKSSTKTFRLVTNISLNVGQFAYEEVSYNFPAKFNLPSNLSTSFCNFWTDRSANSARASAYQKANIITCLTKPSFSCKESDSLADQQVPSVLT